MDIQALIKLDQQLLLWFNNHQTDFLNHFFSLYTGKVEWIFAAAVIVFILIKNYKKESIWILVLLVLTVVLTDQISNVIKYTVARPRPTHEPLLQGLVKPVFGNLAGKYGFLSAHAANSFAFALFTTLLFKNRIYGVVIFLWAALNAYTRMYLGVHYPGDILAGSLLGLMVASFTFGLLDKIVLKKSVDKKVSRLDLSFIYIALGLTVLALAFISILRAYVI
ncbi:MAG: phosphatase PAP2 family protein [Paludibacteraceae bacterium]|nr:phosphatase PAP2 family protein [Paludibacteraceae bacterium]MBO7316723.1 phosphatase PAP2 family protein [Paludibacteraceae bacterium]